MVRIQQGDKSFEMDNMLHDNLMLLKRKVCQEDFDGIIIIAGDTGTGKSVLAQQIAYVLDDTFNLSRIAYTPEKAKEVAMATPRYCAYVFDESVTGLSSRDSMTKKNKNLVQFLTQARQENKFALLLIPSFFDLEKPVSLYLSKLLINVYLYNNAEQGIIWRRGYFAFYNNPRKKKLWLFGKKGHEYSVVKPNFLGRFNNYYTVPEQDYRALKRKALQESIAAPVSPMQAQRDSLMKVCSEEGWSQETIANGITKYSGTTMTRQNVSAMVRGKK